MSEHPWADLDAGRTGEGPRPPDSDDGRWLAELAADLGGNGLPAHSGDTWPVDAAVLAAAGAAATRGRRMRRRPLLIAGGLAAAVVLAFLGWPRLPSLPNDFNDDGKVDVVDALLMAESIQSGGQQATAEQVDALMLSLVRVEGEG